MLKLNYMKDIKQNQKDTPPQKSKSRLLVLEKITQYEKQGWFSKDVEEDPPTFALTPDKVDYLCKKPLNKLLTYLFNQRAWGFIHHLLKTKKMIIKEITGFENYLAVEDKGVILTCNHFNPYDNFAIHFALEHSLKSHHRNLYKVIREGNYTNFPGLYGLFFRHCNTLPLSQNLSVMKLFMTAIKTLLLRGEKILVYAEQGMWWNYKKPRPLTPGAFRFAVENNAPVLPIFITMQDSSLVDTDGFFVPEYTIHFLPALYAEKRLSLKQNVQNMKDKNFCLWKNVYETVYKKPLVYTTDKEKLPKDILPLLFSQEQQK